MGKLGVGIGDEFPIDDGKPSGENAQREPRNDPEYEARREEWRKARDSFREQRRRWRETLRAKWREKHRAYREEMRARYEAGEDVGHWHHDHWHGPRHGGPRFLFPLLALVGLLMVIVFIFNHMFILFGLLVLAGLFFAYHRGFDHFDLVPAGYGAPPPAPPASPSATDAPKG